MKNLKTLVPTCILGSALVVIPGAGFGSAAFAQDDKPPTADTQKNRKSDLETTAKIRKALMADNTLSMSAHNVKIITRDGMVTLRGKVNSDTEKDAIVAKAREIAGASDVTDDLTVKAPK